MNTARQLQIAILLIVSLATGIAMIAGASSTSSVPATAQASQLPIVTVIGKRMSRQEKAAFAQRTDSELAAAQTAQLPTVTVIGKRVSKNLTPAATA